MSKPRVHIPRTKLRAQLDEAAAIKTEMTDLLRELEQSAAANTAPGSARATAPAKPGGWRHDPLGWAKRYLP